MNRQIEFKICIRRKFILGEVEGWVFGRSPGWIEASQGFIACVVDAMLGGGDAALGCKAVEDYCVGVWSRSPFDPSCCFETNSGRRTSGGAWFRVSLSDGS